MIDNITYFFLTQIENCYSMLYLEKLMVIAAEYVNLKSFEKGLEILLSEIQLLRTSLYLNEAGKGYSILENVFTNSILIDQTIQKISKTHLYFSGSDFSKIDKLFVENKIDQLMSDYDALPRITQTTDHLNDVVWWYIGFAVIFLLVVIALVIKKAMWVN